MKKPVKRKGGKRCRRSADNDKTTTGYVPVDDVLLGAEITGLRNVVILGTDKRGKPYFAASAPDRITHGLVAKFQLFMAENQSV